MNFNNEKKITNPQPTFRLISEHGVFFGQHKGNTIAKPTDVDGHVLVVGGVGSGKSSCIAIPSLQRWGGRVFAIDIKGELYKKTKDSGRNIKVFNPLDKNAFGYDPFYTFALTENKAQEAQAIAFALLPKPPDIKEPFWIDSARSLLTGAILHFRYTKKNFLETIHEILFTPIKTLIEALHKSEANYVKYFVNQFVKMADETLGSVYAELCRHITVYVTDEDIKNCLSKPTQNCIIPTDLDNGKDIYIIIPEYLLEQWKNLFSLMVSQFLTYFEKRDEEDINLEPILFLLDEFPRLGKNEKITHALATLRSKKITICILIQSLAQLDETYGQNTRRVICDTCSYKAVLGAGDPETQKIFSDLVGTYDKEKESRSQNYGWVLPSGSGTTTTTEEKRIIKPEDFATLPSENIVVLLTQYGFFKIEKRRYDGRVIDGFDIKNQGIIRGVIKEFFGI